MKELKSLKGRIILWILFKCAGSLKMTVKTDINEDGEIKKLTFKKI